MFKIILSQLSFSLLLGVSFTAQAELVPLSDEKLSEVTGQAFINLTTDSHAGIDYTRLNLGVKIETQLNMKKLQLGGYNRSGESSGNDILINDFALGTVGANDTINPFLIQDPFIELAYQGGKIVGLRVGFGEAKGTLSGDIASLSGRVPVHIEGTARPIFDAANFFQRAALTLAGVTRSTRLQSDATLVTAGGEYDPVRASIVGMLDGQALECVSGCNLGGITSGLLELFSSTNCGVLGLATCYPLTNFKSLPVGNLAIADQANTQAIEGAAKGFFISMQSQDVAWRDLDTGAFETAIRGAFLNLPKYRDANGNLVSPLNVDFESVFNGIPRSDTCLGTAAQGC